MATAITVTDARGATAYAKAWTAAWNRLDVEQVLSHFAEDCRFTSPRALATVGRATVEGRDALRAYWQTAVSRITSLTFTLDRALWDAERRTVAVLYDAEINGQRTRAVEIMRFDEGGLVVDGEALYGA
jgi:ketosteroid isomerase-like protein